MRQALHFRSALSEEGFATVMHDDPLVLLSQVGFEVIDAEEEETALLEHVKDIRDKADNQRRSIAIGGQASMALLERTKTHALINISESLKILAAPYTSKL
jgi:hypothetical protein